MVVQMPLLTGGADAAWRLRSTANSKAALGMVPIAKRSEARLSNSDVTQTMPASTRRARHDPFLEVTAADDQHMTATAELRSGNDLLRQHARIQRGTRNKGNERR
jgi:hypothetical protein